MSCGGTHRITVELDAHDAVAKIAFLLGLHHFHLLGARLTHRDGVDSLVDYNALVYSFLERWFLPIPAGHHTMSLPQDATGSAAVIL